MLLTSRRGVDELNDLVTIRERGNRDDILSDMRAAIHQLQGRGVQSPQVQDSSQLNELYNRVHSLTQSVGQLDELSKGIDSLTQSVEQFDQTAIENLEERFTELEGDAVKFKNSLAALTRKVNKLSK